MGDPVGYIFLSYSRKDKGIVEQLENQLETAGYEMWIDVEGIRGGDLWREAIVKAIDQADALLVLLSPNSAKSDNVRTEVDLAAGRKTRIVPVDISTPPVIIPPSMQYPLAGKQRVKFPTEFEKLLEALDRSRVAVEAQPEVTAPPGPPPPLAAPVPKQRSLPWLGIGLVVVTLVAVGAIGLLVGQSSNGGTQGGTGTTESKAAQTAMGVVQAIPTTVTPTNTPTDTPTGTATATATPTGTPTPTDTPTATAIPSGTPTPTNTPTATPTATPRFPPTQYKVGDYFEDIWQEELGAGESDLGYPEDREISSNIVVQNFEKGIMYWWENPNGPNYIWVLPASTPVRRGGTHWYGYDDNWKEVKGLDDFSCEAARDGGGPIRGFGKVWCDHRSEWQTDLGSGEPEQGSSDGRVQFFQGGVMLYNPLDAEVYVLFDQEEWKRFK
jgi:hypothetical protein